MTAGGEKSECDPLFRACEHVDRPVRARGLCSSCYMKQTPCRAPEYRRKQRERGLMRSLVVAEEASSVERTEAFRWLLREDSAMHGAHRTAHTTSLARALSGEKADRRDGGVHQVHRTMRVHTECLGWAVDFLNGVDDDAVVSVLDPCAGSGQILEVMHKQHGGDGRMRLLSNDLICEAPEWYAEVGVPHTRHDVFGPLRSIPRADFVVCSPPYLVCEPFARRLIADRKARVAYFFHCTTDFVSNGSFERREWWDRFEEIERRSLRIEGLPVNTCEGANRDEVTVTQRRNAWIVIFTSRRMKKRYCRYNLQQVVSFHRLQTLRSSQQ